MSRVIVLALLIAFASVPFHSYALGNESLTLTKQSGNYSVEIDYPNPFVAGVPEFLNTLLFSGGTPAAYTIVTFTVLDAASQPVFNADIAHEPGKATGASIVFPTEGSYTVEAIFKDESATVALASFPVSVAAASAKQNGVSSGEWAGAGLIVGLIAGLVIAPYFRRYERSVAMSDR